MKLFLLTLLIFSTCCFADLYKLYVEQIESEKNDNQSKAADMTKDALMAVPGMQERADYFLFKVKNLTFGEYSDQVMYIAPLVTGDVEFSAHKFKVYYNHFDNKAGVRYKIKF